MKVFALLLLLPVMAAHGGSVYLCRAYSGGTFWSQAHCNTHNALIESIVSVPDGFSWEQQVNLAEQSRRGSVQQQVQQQIQQQASTTQANEHLAKQAECRALEARITQLDGMARQPQSGQTQDWIRVERKTARDRQFAIRCQ